MTGIRRKVSSFIEICVELTFLHGVKRSQFPIDWFLIGTCCNMDNMTSDPTLPRVLDCIWYGTTFCDGDVVEDLYRWWFKMKCSRWIIPSVKPWSLAFIFLDLALVLTVHLGLRLGRENNNKHRYRPRDTVVNDQCFYLFILRLSCVTFMQ